MNLEFLQTIRNTQPQQDPCSRSVSQALYLISSKLLERTRQKIEEAIQDNQEYQEGMAIAQEDATGKLQQLITNLYRIEESSKTQVAKMEASCMVARLALLSDYGKFIKAQPGCPEEIQNLFTPEQRLQISGQPIEDQLVELALQTQWYSSNQASVSHVDVTQNITIDDVSMENDKDYGQNSTIDHAVIKALVSRATIHPLPDEDKPWEMSIMNFGMNIIDLYRLNKNEGKEKTIVYIKRKTNT
jgi:hypothetical protein